MTAAPMTEFADVDSWEMADSLWERIEPLVENAYKRATLDQTAAPKRVHFVTQIG